MLKYCVKRQSKTEFMVVMGQFIVDLVFENRTLRGSQIYAAGSRLNSVKIGSISS